MGVPLYHVYGSNDNFASNGSWSGDGPWDNRNRDQGWNDGSGYEQNWFNDNFGGGYQQNQNFNGPARGKTFSGGHRSVPYNNQSTFYFNVLIESKKLNIKK